MFNLIQGPVTNQEGLQHVMDQLNNGADHVECTIVNYQKRWDNVQQLNNHSALYDADEEEGLRKATFYVVI